MAKTGVNILFAVKLLSVAFEYLAAYYIGQIIRLKYDNKKMIWIAMVVIPLIPTVILNSSYLSQCDSIYAGLTVASIYYILKNKPLASMFFLGMAIVFKVQAVFILPFFLVLLLKGNIKWYYFGLIPIIYLASLVPAWCAGRPATDLLGIYLRQSDHYHFLTMNFPNVYIFFSNQYYEPIKYAGLLFSVLIIITGALLIWKKKNFSLNYSQLIQLAYISVVIVPFVLPGMHERYMYMADILGLAYLFVNPGKWYLPLGIVTVSLYSYIRCSKYNDMLPQEPAFFLLLLIIGLLIASYIKEIKQADETT
jgi:Gpi18-like mannosyltransferase